MPVYWQSISILESHVWDVIFLMNFSVRLICICEWVRGWYAEWSGCFLISDGDLKTDGFSIESCRSMVAVMDVSFLSWPVCGGGQGPGCDLTKCGKSEGVWILSESTVSVRFLLTLTLLQSDSTGKLGFHEFKHLWNNIKKWQVSI